MRMAIRVIMVMRAMRMVMTMRTMRMIMTMAMRMAVTSLGFARTRKVVDKRDVHCGCLQSLICVRIFCSTRPARKLAKSMNSLVGYSSESEEEPPAKRRKLPPISPSISPPTPIENPALHQGRLRTTPHVEGQFAAHVYISLPLGRQSEFYKLVQEIFLDAKEAVPTLREIWPDRQRPELHISLSRPIFLRAHQREELKRSVKNVARSQKP